MTLLENFGAESSYVRFRWPYGNNSASLLPGKVASPVATGIPKSRKESHPERTRNRTGTIFSHFLSDWQAAAVFEIEPESTASGLLSRNYHKIALGSIVKH